MQSANKRAPTKAERIHVERIKSMPCVICNEPGPSDAHHIKQESGWHCVPLCKSCHTGRNGIHGERHMWKLKKMDEVDALAATVERLMCESHA